MRLIALLVLLCALPLPLSTPTRGTNLLDSPVEPTSVPPGYLG